MCKDVCIIIPEYKSKERLSKSLGSILRQQNIKQEVIIIDNGTNDDISDWLNHIVMRYSSVRVIRYSKPNIANAKNLAINKSNCKFIAFLDSGDTWHENKLFKQIKLIEKSLGRLKAPKNHPRICDIDIIDFNGKCLITNFMYQPIEVPHINMHKRSFVLIPLYEISKQWIHPKFKINIVKLLSYIPSNDLRSIKLD